MKQVIQLMRKGKTIVAEVPPPALQPKTALIQTASSLVSAGTERMLVDFAGKSLLGKARSRPDLVRQVMDKVKREGLLTTLDATTNKLDQPMALGYSSAGTILQVGSGLKGFKVGDRVACAGGGFAVHAEMAVIPQNLLVPLAQVGRFRFGRFCHTRRDRHAWLPAGWCTSGFDSRSDRIGVARLAGTRYRPSLRLPGAWDRHRSRQGGFR